MSACASSGTAKPPRAWIVPLVDFFCDPNGERDWVNTALVNVRQGFNAYFPMPFRKSARVELLYDGPLPAGRELESIMPCYSYVCYHTLKRVPADTGYFCASWRQEELFLGQKEYVALETTGRGKFVGWNVTVRNPYLDKYPVDENEKFFIDGETNASVEFQGLEDSFGFSCGFPPTENLFPLTGYFPFHTNGGAAYRFFVQDAINFHKSLKVSIGFGEYGSRLEMELFSTPSIRCNFPPPFIGIKSGRTRPCRKCCRPPNARPRPGDCSGLPDCLTRLLRISRPTAANCSSAADYPALKPCAINPAIPSPWTLKSSNGLSGPATFSIAAWPRTNSKRI